ncbi:hypothetical protein DSL72_001662 [Monilinia vaccinii-corymbosi]|uniref:Uncharacterized protein n=1 Tax=Monilinia vaccinii-corymbosi TaxID=61207 RepID=A0A8A3P2N1_9HELO|nr:hypothetical protein DSL72_001662 [Monilinia vaccinii-corymbosi]
MDPRRSNPFNPTAEEFTPTFSTVNTTISGFPTQNVTATCSGPNNAAATRSAASYGTPSQYSRSQQNDGYDPGNTYQQRYTHPQAGSYRQDCAYPSVQENRSSLGYAQLEHLEPSVQENRSSLQYGNFHHQAAPMNRSFYRQLQAHHELSAQDNRSSLQYGNFQHQGALMNRPFYPWPQQNYPYQQFAPDMQASRGMGQYGTHLAWAAPVVPPVAPFGQMPTPLFQGSVPPPGGMASRNNPPLHRGTPAITPRTSIATSEIPTPTSASTSKRDGGGTPEVTDSKEAAGKKKGPMKPEKAALLPEDLLPGCIVWLANYQAGHEIIPCVKNHECNDPEKEKGGRNHPVVILEINQRHGSNILGDLVCKVAIMTTLTGLGMESYLHKLRTIGPDESAEWFFKHTMPLSWQPQKKRGLSGAKLEQARETERRLEMEHGPELLQLGNGLLSLSRGTMQKRTYVRVHHIYAVPLKQLQACSVFAGKAWMVRLNEESYRTVMERLGLQPGPWEDDLRRSMDTAPERLLRLRDEEMARVHASELAQDQSSQDEAAQQRCLHAGQQSSWSDVAAGQAKSDGY